MASLTSNQACKKLANDLVVYPPSAKDWDLRGPYDDLLSKIQAAARSPDHPSGGIAAATAALAIYFGQVVHRQSSHGSNLCTLLANTTRDVPFWRPYFGLTSRPGVEQNRQQMAGDVYQQLGSDHPDCVLEVARRVLTRQWSEPSSQLFRSALRLIANCCAENDFNRSVIVRRGGIEFMMHLARWRRECDLLLPTMYNVCVDFDEPATDANGEPWKPLDQTQTEPDQESGPIVNAAEQRLGMCWELSDGSTSVETLLDTIDHAEGCYSTLADLVEMASRVSLYGVHNLVSQLTGNDSDEIVEASTISVIDALLTQGSILTRQDPECCASICQAIMNIFSQKPTRQGLISIEGALWQLINLPYLTPNTDKEINESLNPYKKVILKLVYEVSSLEAYGNKFNVETKLIQSCLGVLFRGLWNMRPSSPPSASPSGLSETIEAYPYSSTLVLLSNSIVSTDRAIALLQTSPRLTFHLAGLIQNVSDYEILHPAIDLATRLALCDEGQKQLYKAGILRAVGELLKPTSEVNGAGIEIQRETINLIRLVIKGHGEYTSALNTMNFEFQHGSHTDQDGSPHTEQSLVARVFHLFHHTTDTATKTAIGRLVIELLRTMASASNLESVVSTENSKTQALSTLESRLNSIFDPSATSTSLSSDSSAGSSRNPALPIADIITQTQDQPAAQEAEAWFGLGLLSSFPSFHASILHALAADNNRLLTRLKDIVAESGNNAAILVPTATDNATSQPLSSSVTSGLATVTLTESEIMRPSSANPTPPPNQPPTPPQQQDARYANVKVFVVRMVQSQQGLGSTASDHEDIKVVRDALEAAAADLGVDWVLV